MICDVISVVKIISCLISSFLVAVSCYLYSWSSICSMNDFCGFFSIAWHVTFAHDLMVFLMAFFNLVDVLFDII